MSAFRTLGLLGVVLGLVFNPLHEPVIAVCGFALAAYVAADYMIPVAGPELMKVGLFGRDRLKTGSNHEIPESLGSVIGAIYIFVVLLFTPFTLSAGGLVAYLSGILSIQSMVMLGFADDMFDLRWRHKFFLPAIAAVPMLIVYYVEHGNTHIALPPGLNLGSSIDLGWLYYAYMAAMAIFATNCINIYAGVNGLEAGQTAVVAASVLANDLIYIGRYYWHATVTADAAHAHALSVYFVLPLLAGTLALLKWNWYPARVFVGDTFCYFAGMVFAVAGILGHFSKTMLSLILPQIVNFMYSLPQLFRIVPCPRHRMPNLDPAGSGKLVASRADVTRLPPWKLHILRLLARTQLLRIWETPGKHGAHPKIEISNMTLINLVLVHFGPLHEETLVRVLLGIQALSCTAALIARHMLGKLVFGRDNI